MGLSGLGLAAIVGCGPDDGNDGPTSTPGIVIDPPPETTTIRLGKIIGLPRTAPMFLAEQFLPAEGFTDVQYIEQTASDQGLQQIATGEIDIGLTPQASLTVAVDRGDPLVVLGGLHSSLFEMFGNDEVRSLRDLKGKSIAATRDPTDPVYAFWAALLAYVGIDVEHDVDVVEAPPDPVEFVQAWLAGTIDATFLTRPYSTTFRNANIGHVIIDGLVDPPWSQYFMGMATGNREFVEKHPAATKRALRAILKATDVCAREPERAARYLVDKGYTQFGYEQALEAGLVKSDPDELIARATDWRYLDEIKRELAV